MRTYSKRFVAIAVLIVSFLLMGCSLTECASDKQVEDQQRAVQQMLEDAKEAEEHMPEPDQALASGEILSVRVNYGATGATQCQVRIDNGRNDWYDERERTAEYGLGGSEKNYDDYGFGSTMFNQQITNPNNAPLYTPEAVEGYYDITITSSTGGEIFGKTYWDGEKFEPDLLYYTLD